MNYAVMPVADYDAACDKIREKAEVLEIKFEDTDFGYIRTTVFTPKASGQYIFTIEVKDNSKLDVNLCVFANPEWDAMSHPGMFEVVNSNTISGKFGTSATRIFIDNRLGLKAEDIVSATLSYNGEVVESFVEPKNIKSGELADMVDVVYGAGAESGKQAEYDRFWDVFQQNGNRVSYDNAFAGVGWTDETFNPKYKAMPTSAYMMFRYAEITKDISEAVDFSNCKNFGYTFYAAKLKTVNVNATQSTSLLSAFASASIETLHLIVSSAGATTNDTFTNMRLLKNFTIEGVISGGNINISASTALTVDGAKNLINALADNMGTDNEFKYKVTFSEATKSLLEAEGATAPNGDTWLNYMTAKGWNR